MFRSHYSVGSISIEQCKISLIYVCRRLVFVLYFTLSDHHVSNSKSINYYGVTAEWSDNSHIKMLSYSFFTCIWCFAEPPDPPNTSAQRHPDSIVTGVPTTTPSNISKNPQQNIQVRGVEVGIVLLVLVVWIAAIALFFNRWGKIRMLLPYQPDYKEQLKVPGSGVCAVAAGGPCPGQQHGSSQGCPQVSTLKLV